MWLAAQAAVAETPGALLGAPSAESMRDFLGWYIVWEVFNWLRTPEGTLFVVSLVTTAASYLGVRMTRSPAWRIRLRAFAEAAAVIAVLFVVLGVADGSLPVSPRITRATVSIVLAMLACALFIAWCRRVIHEVGRMDLARLTIVETSVSFDLQATYKLKIHVNVANDTGQEIKVRCPTRWIGTPLHYPRKEQGIASTLQLWNASDWIPKDGADQVAVPAGRVFRFWLGFDIGFFFKPWMYSSGGASK